MDKPRFFVSKDVHYRIYFVLDRKEGEVVAEYNDWTHQKPATEAKKHAERLNRHLL